MSYLGHLKYGSTNNLVKVTLDRYSNDKYYFDLKISKDLYYKLEIFSDDKKVVESECKKISNNTRVEFNIEFLGINNYGKITVFSDECINKITEYKTHNYNNDKSIK